MKALLTQRLIDILHRETDETKRLKLIIRWVKEEELSDEENMKLIRFEKTRIDF